MDLRAKLPDWGPTLKGYRVAKEKLESMWNFPNIVAYDEDLK